MKEKFVKWCKKHKYKYLVGYDWCDCNDFGDYVNVVINGKTHTLYCLFNGKYHFDKTMVETIEDIEGVLKNADER